MIQEPNLLGSDLDHRQDAGADRLGQLGPGGHDGGQIGGYDLATVGRFGGAA